MSWLSKAAGKIGGVARTVGGPAAWTLGAAADAIKGTDYQQPGVDTSQYTKSGQQLADRSKKTADDYQRALPGLQADQISASQGASRRALAGSIQNVKADASRRGLLFSGVNEGNQAEAKGQESSKLAGNIQDINQKTNATNDQYQQQALTAQSQADSQGLAAANFAAQQNETAYQQALGQQQSKNGFLAGIMGSASRGIGGLLGMG